MRKSRKYRRHSLLDDSDDHNPMSGVINVFDVAIVLVMALMVVLAMSPHMPSVLKLGENTTIVRNPGSQNMQIVVKEEGKPIEVLNMTDKIGGGTGEVLGTCLITLKTMVHLHQVHLPLQAHLLPQVHLLHRDNPVHPKLLKQRLQNNLLDKYDNLNFR
jgi:hypothetical protein